MDRGSDAPFLSDNGGAARSAPPPPATRDGGGAPVGGRAARRADPGRIPALRPAPNAIALHTRPCRFQDRSQPRQAHACRETEAVPLLEARRKTPRSACTVQILSQP